MRLRSHGRDRVARAVLGCLLLLALSAAGERHTVRVTAARGQATSASTPVAVDDGAPTARIDLPTGSDPWAVGDVLAFAGGATDPDEGELPASALAWTLTLHPCPSTEECQGEVPQLFEDVAEGSFAAPDSPWPAHLELSLTATDSTGLQSTTTLRLDPRTVGLTLQSIPSGLPLDLGGAVGPAPLDGTVIVGATTSIGAPVSAEAGGYRYELVEWSDGGAPTHAVTATATPATYTATYRRLPGGTFPPSSVVVRAGLLAGGAASALAAADDDHLVVSSTTAGTPTVNWQGRFHGVPNEVTSLSLTYEGQAAPGARQTIAVWNWTRRLWVQLDSRTVGPGDVRITDLDLAGSLADFVSGGAGIGQLWVRARSTHPSTTFVSNGDLMQLTFDEP